jgi:hypothetical protein
MYFLNQEKGLYVFGLWSMVFLDYVGLRKAPRAVIWMLAGQVWACQRSPSLPPQYRQCRIRGRDLAPDMQVGCGFFLVTQ